MAHVGRQWPYHFQRDLFIQTNLTAHVSRGFKLNLDLLTDNPPLTKQATPWYSSEGVADIADGSITYDWPAGGFVDHPITLTIQTRLSGLELPMIYRCTMSDGTFSVNYDSGPSLPNQGHLIFLAPPGLSLEYEPNKFIRLTSGFGFIPSAIGMTWDDWEP